MSEMEDPFVPPEADDIMSSLQVLYAAGMRAGFPEQRAFELVRDLFVSQMATLQMLTLSRTEREG